MSSLVRALDVTYKTHLHQLCINAYMHSPEFKQYIAAAQWNRERVQES